MTLDNGLTRLEFDEATGSLVQVRDLRTGYEYLGDAGDASARGDGRLFRVFAPDPEQWIDRHADSHLSGRPQMDLKGDTLSIRWRDMRTAEGVAAGVSAVVSVQLPAGADEASFTLELENTSPHVVCEVMFPWVGGWRGYPGEKGTIQVGTHWPIDPFTGLRRNDGWNLMNMTRKLSVGFPHVNIPLCDVSNGSIGLSFNFYPHEKDLNYDMCVLDLNERLGDPHPSFGWIHRPFLAPGETWKSGRVGLAPHQGDWHDAALRMRGWLAGWWRPPAPRGRLHRSIGFHNVMFRDFTGRHHRPLSAMPGIARHGRDLGLDHMIVWDMPLLGMYLRAGTGSIFDDEPGRAEDLSAALRGVRDLGVHVSPLLNMRLGTQSNPFWRERGADFAIRSQYGQPAPETLPLRQHTALLINRALDQGGAPGHEGVCAWIPRAADLVHARGPESYVVGEVPDTWNTQFFDLWWFWDWSWLRPEIFRFVMPESLQSWVIDAYDHEDQVGKAFAQGFLLNLNVRSLEKTLADVPEFAARVAALSALKEKTYDVTLAGRFMDRTGLTLEAPAEITAAVYDTGSGVGIILGEGSRTAGGGSPTQLRGGKVRLTLDSRILGDRQPGTVTIHRQDGSSRSVAARRRRGGITVETAVGRRESVVVVMEAFARPPAA